MRIALRVMVALFFVHIAQGGNDLGYVVTTASDGHIQDSNLDGIGDEVKTTWVFYSIGESSTDVNMARSWTPFVLDVSDKTLIADAEKIELEFYLSVRDNIGHAPIDLYGYSGRITDVAVSNDYDAADLLLIQTGIVNSETPLGNVRVDVTDFVKMRAASSGVVSFQMRLQDESRTLDGLRNRYLINSSKSTTTPGYPRLVASGISPVPPPQTPVGLQPGSTAPSPLSNTKTKIEFYPASMGGGIRQITDLQSGYEFIHGGAIAQLWNITLVKTAISNGLPEWAEESFDPATSEGTKDDFGAQGPEIIIASHTLTNGVVSALPNGLRFSWTGIDVEEESGVLDVSIDVVLDPKDEFARFRASFSNRSTDYTVFYLTAPIVEGIYPADGRIHNDRIAMPLYLGRLTQNPIKNGLPTGALTSTVSFQPNRASHSMQFDAYYHANQGLYMGAFDGEQNVVRYRLEAKSQTGLSWGMVHIPNNMRSEPQVWSTPYDTVVRCFDGDWYDACRIYRAWAQHQRWAALGKVVDRNDIPLWFKEMDEWFSWHDSEYAPQLDPTYDLLSDFNVGSRTVMWGKDHHFDGYNPERFPLDAQSVDFIARKDAAGWPIMAYIQSIIWDRRSAQFATYSGLDSVIRNVSGQYVWGNFSAFGEHDATFTAPTTLWEAALGGTVEKMAESGYRAAYLDSGNWGGTHLNFNPLLGSDVGGGNDYIKSHQQMLRNIKTRARLKDPEFCFSAESVWEGNIDVIDAQLSVNTTHRYLEKDVVSAIPMLSTVYHDYMMFFGAWVNRYDLELDGGKSYIAKFGQHFIEGGKGGFNQFGMLLPPPYSGSLTNNARSRESSLKRYAAYAAARKFLTYGERMRPPEFASFIPEVTGIKWHRGWTTSFFDVSLPSTLSSYWKAPDGSYGLALYNITDTPQSVIVSLNESDYDVDGGYFSVNRIYPSPVQTQSVTRVLVGTNWTTQISLTVPADSPMVLELEIDTSGNGIPNSIDDDDDDDGMLDTDEGIAGTDPLDPDSLFRIEAGEVGPNGWTLHWSSRPWKTYHILGSESLTEPFDILQEDIPADGETTSNNVPLFSESDTYFYQIKVE